jgi:hypothetical protein
VIADVATPLVVFALSGSCAVGLHNQLRRFGDRSDIPMTERFGLSVILAVLLIALCDTALSFSLGSRVTAFVLPALALAPALLAVLIKRRPVEGLPVARLLIACLVSSVFLIAIAHKLFFFRELSRLGLLYVDLPWHIGRATQQAFLATSGFLPLSPIAFPGSLPFQAPVADSLVAATFRLLPFPIHAFHYSQALFCWAMVLWTAVLLVAGPGVWRSIVVLSSSLLAVPAFLYGPGQVGTILYVFLHANPNSLIAWPIGVALAMHVYRSFRRQTTPWAPALLFIAPASLLFKPNIALSFMWLEAAGFGVWLWRARIRFVWPAAALGAAVWLAAIVAARAMGPSPVAVSVHPALRNFGHYALVAFGIRSPLRLLLKFLLDAAGAVAIAFAAAAVSPTANGDAGEMTRRREAVVTLVALSAAVAYVGLGWWLVVPTGPSEGEPMHVNFELIMWLVTVLLVATLIGDDQRRAARGPGARAAASCAVLFAGAVMAWSVQHPPPAPGSITPSLHDFEPSVEARVRESVAAAIPDGNCFWYGRRYAIDVGSAFDPDFTIGATGCPVINGKRWAGYLGNNRPELLRGLPTIDVPAGPGFELVAVSSK